MQKDRSAIWKAGHNKSPNKGNKMKKETPPNEGSLRDFWNNI